MRRPEEDRSKLDMEKYAVTRELKRRYRIKEWVWTEERAKACCMLAEGKSIAGVAKEIGCSTDTIDNWRGAPEFASEVDRLTLMTGIALPAHRMRIIKAAIDQRIAEDGTVLSKKDILEWMKLANEEMEGVRTTLLAALHRDVLDNASPGDKEFVLGQAGGGRGEGQNGVHLNEEERDITGEDGLDDISDG